MAFLVVTVSSSSLQSVPTARMRVSVTPLHSFLVVSVSFGFSTVSADSLEPCVEKDEDGVHQGLKPEVLMLLAALSYSLLERFFFGRFPASIFILFFRLPHCLQSM